VRNARRLVPLTVLAAALAAATAACGSSSPPVDPLAGLTSKQIATKAVGATETAPAVHITGTGDDSGKSITIDLTFVRGKGCQGSFSEASLGSLKMVYDGTTVWMLPDASFYKDNGVPSTVAGLLNGKYIKLKGSTSGLGSLTQVCSLSGLLGNLTPDASLTKGVKMTLNGQSVIRISDTKGTGYAYVSDMAPPELLMINKTGSSGGQLNFSYTGVATSITPPPAGQTIDGSKYGL
jgi:hypothetical protein